MQQAPPAQQASTSQQIPTFQVLVKRVRETPLNLLKLVYMLLRHNNRHPLLNTSKFRRLSFHSHNNREIKAHVWDLISRGPGVEDAVDGPGGLRFPLLCVGIVTRESTGPTSALIL